MVTDRSESHVLTGPLTRWEVDLVSGDKVVVWAHAVGEEPDRFVFSALMKGTPHYEVEIASFPKSVAVDFFST